jgi:hypothetical protein
MSGSCLPLPSLLPAPGSVHSTLAAAQRGFLALWPAAAPRIAQDEQGRDRVAALNAPACAFMRRKTNASLFVRRPDLF